jgi:flavin-dependent dehydrogenase
MEETQLLIVGCGPAGGIAARDAAAAGVRTLVLEKDAVVGAKRVCAAGLRPQFCRTFDLPAELVHCDTPRLALFDEDAVCHELFVGPAHTTTREELDGAIAQMARAAGAEIRTQALFRSMRADRDGSVVEYADLISGERKRVRARNVFFATGATARLEESSEFAYPGWQDGLLTCYQYRLYLERPAAPIAYQTLELHYYRAANGRQIVGWMFPKRDHLAVGLGVAGKMPGAQLREELNRFAARIERRLHPGIPATVKEEGHLLYGGMPRPSISGGAVMIGGTAAGLVDATNGEGIFEAAMSGRLAAASVQRHAGERAAREYAQAVQERFYGRLKHRAALMRFLEKRPRRFGMLFRQLAQTPRFADILQREDSFLKVKDRIYLYGQAVKFAARAVAG